jgi:type I restriction-modification system DNA methylase subunit
MISRKAMGEFYTNDRLVDEVLDNLGYVGEDVLVDATLLDPTCGSGTFLFHAIRRFIQSGEEAGLNDLQIARGVGENINGIDLHPFAVAMGRTNFLLALATTVDWDNGLPVNSVAVWKGLG